MKHMTVALGFCLTGWALAQPAINRAMVLDGVRVWPDAIDPQIAHYAPRSIELAKRADGLPEFSLVQMRYVGRRSTQDEGKFETKSVLSIQLRTAQVTVDRVRQLEKLYEETTRQSVKLVPIPTSQFESSLNLIRIGEAVPADEKEKPLGKGQVEGSGVWSPTDYWSDRTLVLFLDDATSMVLSEALRKGQSILSFSFRFQSNGVIPDGSEWKPEVFDSASQVIPLSINPEQAGDVIRQVDLNERTPANYPLLSVYCFGFRDELLKELSVREVLIEATGVSGRRVVATYQFWDKQRDVTLARVRFPFAVDMKKGYRYQLRDVSQNGEETRTEWVSVTNWFAPLDVSGGSISWR